MLQKVLNNSRLIFSSIDESFKGHWTAGEAFEDYEAAADKAFIDVEADREYLQAVEVAQECLRCRGQLEGCVTARPSLQQLDVNIGITFSVAVRSWRSNIKSVPFVTFINFIIIKVSYFLINIFIRNLLTFLGIDERCQSNSLSGTE